MADIIEFIKRNARYRGPRESYKIDTDRRELVQDVKNLSSALSSIEAEVDALFVEIYAELEAARDKVKMLTDAVNNIGEGSDFE